MAKKNTKFVCNNCGATFLKLLGKCPDCNQWNTIEEQTVIDVSTSTNNRFKSMTKISSKVEDLSEVNTDEKTRIATDIGELDRVLGGGLVEGSVILLGGDPGIGKSTLLLQATEKLNKKANVLYVSGEESSEQISLRAKRLALDVKGVKIYGEVELESILNTIQNEKAKYVIIDSIQTLFSSQLSSAPGSISQVKECATHLNRMAKENGITMIIICHVTKDGELAGPRALEHIVDTVLYFEGDKNNQFRLIRAFKNRFGAINEVGVFSMGEQGLEEIKDPGGVFMGEENDLPGSSVFISQEGNRSMLIEIQALLDTTPLPNPIRRTIGLDLNRLQMICAVINKFIAMPVYSQNIFVSLIGGMKINDTGIDLPTFLAMISSHNGTVLPKTMASFGEIGLTGEIRTVQNAEDRIREAARLGIKKVIVPPLNKKTQDNLKKLDIEIIECKNLAQVINKIFK